MLLEADMAEQGDKFDRQRFDASLNREPPTAADAMMEHLANLRSVPGFTLPPPPVGA